MILCQESFDEIWGEQILDKDKEMHESNHQKDNKILAKVVKEKLDWYISEASDEEYEEAEVESLQQVLEKLEPVAEDLVPDVDEAWNRFWARVEGAEETVIISDAQEKHIHNKSNKLFGFACRHKAIVAAALLLFVLVAGMGMHTKALQNSVFFLCLKNDKNGMQMVTVPDGLDESTEIKNINNYYERDTVPKWAQEWLQMESRIMMDFGCEWDNIEINEYANKNIINSHYLCEENVMTLGIMYYAETVSLNTELFLGYDFMEYLEGSNEIRIYSKMQDSGKIKYLIDFFVDNMYCYVSSENLSKAEAIAIQYYEEMNN